MNAFAGTPRRIGNRGNNWTMLRETSRFGGAPSGGNAAIVFRNEADLLSEQADEQEAKARCLEAINASFARAADKDAKVRLIRDKGVKPTEAQEYAQRLHEEYPEMRKGGSAAQALHEAQVLREQREAVEQIGAETYADGSMDHMTPDDARNLIQSARFEVRQSLDETGIGIVSGAGDGDVDD